jgi:aryl-alcohol dehydrogenase-like predicted oxidoreductase
VSGVPPPGGAGVLGRSGLPVSRIGLGLAAIGRPAYINLGREADLGDDRGVETMRAAAHRLLDAAHAAGVRYLDAARSYGRAEEFLGGWLTERGIAPDQVTVGSKWGYVYVGGWRMDAEVHERKDLGLDNLRHQLGESRALLGEHLDLYQIHSATLESGVLEDAGVLGELERLRASGLAIGLSVSGPRQGETIDRAVGLGLFDTVQATWNLLERSAGESMVRAHEAGLGVIVKEALANGRLTARGGLEPLLAVAAECGSPPDALAMAAVLAQPFVNVVLSGAVSPEMLRSNLAAAQLPAETARDPRLDRLQEPAEEYWATRSALAWS